MNGMSLQDLSCGIPNGQVGQTTVGKVRALGGDVKYSPNGNNLNHSTLSGITAAEAESLLRPTVKNPSKNAKISGAKIGALGPLTTAVHMLTLDACTKGGVTQCFCALSAEMTGQDPGSCMSQIY